MTDLPTMHRMRTYGYILGSVRSAPNAQQKSSGNVKVTYKFRSDKPKEIK